MGQETGINILNTTPKINQPENNALQPVFFEPKMLPDNVKMQAPIEKDAFNLQTKQPPEEEIQDSSEEGKEEIKKNHPKSFFQRIPLAVKILGGVAVGVAALAAWDHFGNDGKLLAKIMGKTQNNSLPEGDSIKNISNNYFTNREISLENKIKELTKEIDSITDTDLAGKLREEIASIEQSKEDLAKTREYFQNESKLISKRGKLEIAYQDLTEKISKKLEKNNNLDITKDKELNKCFNKVDDILDDYNKLTEQLAENNVQINPKNQTIFNALSQGFENEIKERAKNGTLTRQDIIYINGAHDSHSMFRTMRYKDGKLYDFRKGSIDPLICIDKENNLLEDAHQIVNYYKEAFSKAPVIYEVGSQDINQLKALNSWTGQSCKNKNFDPNLYRKMAAHLVVSEFTGFDFNENYTDQIASVLKDEDNKSRFIQKWNESPTLPTLKNIEIVKNGKGGHTKTNVSGTRKHFWQKNTKCENDIRIQIEGEKGTSRLFSRDIWNANFKNRNELGYYDLQRAKTAKVPQLRIDSNGLAYEK